MGQSSVSGVARVLHPAFSRRKTLAVFIAYFDESGGQDKPVYTIGGFIAPERKWRRFEEEWGNVLRAYRVRVFHMTDFENRQGEFTDQAAWPNERRLKFIAALAHIIKNTVTVGVGHSVIVQDFKQVCCPDQPMPDVMRIMHLLLLQSSLEDARAFVPLKRGEQISCICEENSRVKGAVTEHFYGLKRVQEWAAIFSGITFLPKKDFLPLQAADILAYEGYKHVTNQYLAEEQRWPPRKLFLSLERSKRLSMGYYNREALVDFMERNRRAGRLP